MSAPLRSGFGVKIASLGHRNEQMEQTRAGRRRRRLTFDLFAGEGDGILNEVRAQSAQIRKTAWERERERTKKRKSLSTRWWRDGTMVENGKKHRQNSHLIIHYPMSEGVSEVSKQVKE